MAVVTGGAGGIGSACAELLAEEGAEVLACDLQEHGPAYVHPGIVYAHLDVANPDAWCRAFALAPVAGMRLDILVNAAGIGGPSGLAEITLEEWNRVIAVNQTGVMLGTQRAVALFIEHGRGGSIVNVSSIWGSTAVPGLAAYHASKGAVVQITRNTAVTYAGRGIRANAVLPGLIDTPMARRNRPEFNAATLERTPLGRVGRPEEVAACVLFLASDDASYVTGTSLFVDGGYTAL